MQLQRKVHLAALSLETTRLEKSSATKEKYHDCVLIMRHTQRANPPLNVVCRRLE